MSGLVIIGQDDFAAGVIRGVAPDVMPGVGLANAINGLYNDDGDVYRRGGTHYLTAALDALDRPFTFLWSGFLSGKPRILAADNAGLYPVDAVTHAWYASGGAGLLAPCQGAVIHDTLYLPNGWMWGGANTKADYSTGTVATTDGSPALVGTGTTWTTALEVGTLVTIAGQTYRVKSITDNTHITLDRPVVGTASGLAYTSSRFAQWPRPSELDPSAPIRLCAIANRLVVAAYNRMAFSAINAPYSFDPTDYHDLPGGVLVMGLESIKDTLLSFTNFGLWTVQNMAFDLTDAQGNIQQTLSLLTPEVSLWNEAGLCEWAGRIVAPCLDRCFIVDTLSAPTPISDSIAPDYQGYVAGGYTPGQAKVYGNHLLLPILHALEPAAMLACRLDRPVRGRQIYYPWSTFMGHASYGTALDVNLTGATPALVLAGRDRHLTNVSGVFTPTVANASDADGTTHVFDIESRDFPTGNGQPNHVRKLRLRYSMEGAGAILAGYSSGTVAQTYENLKLTSENYADVKASYANYGNVLRGSAAVSGFPPSPDDPERFWTALTAQTPPDPGLDPVSWKFPTAKRVRYMRFRFRTTDAVSKLVLHHLDFAVRPATHNR